MNGLSKFQKFKNIVELFGIVAVVASLILVWHETRQNRILAEISFEMSITQNRIVANQAIGNNSDIWFRGCKNDSLSPAEKVIFQRMMDDKNEIAFYQVGRYLKLDDTESANVVVADFAGFLYNNAGAREIWRKNEERVISNRVVLDVNPSDFWYTMVTESLDKLDKLKIQE